jgi:NAD-dependent deacetylase
MKEQMHKVAEILRKSKHTTAFTGAGISVESGIPPFRGPDGLWSKYDPKVLDLNFFYTNTDEAWAVIKELFYDFFGKAKPNAAHRVLAKLEANGLLNSVITQNIDNMHQAAGSKVVYEFHGTAEKMVCIDCGQKVPSASVDLAKIPPQCAKCNTGILKPDFIFFGEGIPTYAFNKSREEANKADVFIVIGTTGEVMPASSIPIEAKRNGATIIEINPQASNYTYSTTDIFLKGKAGEVMTALEEIIF